MSSSVLIKSDIIWKEFKGAWHNDRIFEGTLLYETGGKYVGQFKNNMRHGKGIYTYPNLIELMQVIAKNRNMNFDKTELEIESFSGEWKDDKKVRGVINFRHGVGVIVKYKGQLLDDRPHGKGVVTFENGDVY